MEEILITEEELEYLTHTPKVAREDTVHYKTKWNYFEEEVKKHKCITLEKFGNMWKDSIDNDPRFI